MNPRPCSIEGCGLPARGRGWCRAHYMRWYNAGANPDLAPPPLADWVNPLVCVCAIPLADNRIQFGQCRICYRKPLALFASSLAQQVAA